MFTSAKRTNTAAATFFALSLAALTGGCATMAKSGALIGAGVGAAAGQWIGDDTEGTLIGAGVGAAAGYMIGNEADKEAAKEKDKERQSENPRQDD